MALIKRWLVGWFGIGLGLSALACSSEKSDGVTHTPVQPKTGTSGDSGNGGEQGDDAGLADLKFSLDGHVEAGGEITDCLFVQMPKDRGEIAVPSAESHYTPGSHHFLVYRMKYTDLPDGGGTVHECSLVEQFANVRGSYYEAQAPDSRRALPPGVAHVFQPGEVLLLTAHYLNTTGQDLDPHVDFRLHTMPRDQVKQEAGSFFFYNYFINVPPFSDVTVTRQCPMSQDVNLALLWSHMHARGVAFEATTSDTDATAQAGEDLYKSLDWSEPTPRDFPSSPPVTIHKGESITYSCEYKNTTANTFVSGVSAATNEMCILHGMYWPRADQETELCLLGKDPTTPVAATDAGNPTKPVAATDAGKTSVDVDATADAH